MKILLLIGTGSFIGGILRYLMSHFIHQKIQGTFPFWTLAVNVLGCLVIGFVFGLAEKGNISSDLKMFLAPGLLGGFTTFSAFSNETFILLNEGQYTQAIMYVLASVLIGLLATFLGFISIKMF